MWEACAEKVRNMGGTILMGQKASSLIWDEDKQKWIVSAQAVGKKGETKVLSDHVISSAPIRELIRAIEPKPSDQARKAAEGLHYRDFLTVTLVLKGEELFDDNWIYIHDPGVKVGRIQNFRSWSPEMVPHPDYHCYGLEYFCFEGDGTWTMRDEDLIELARKEMAKIGLASQSEFVRGYVVRQKKAYPVYDDMYQKNVDTIRAELDSRYPQLHLVGRNGMHKYNNQDHAIMTAMLTAQNILNGKRVYDVWQVNQDAEYHEAGERPSSSGASGLRAVPQRVNQKDAA
jgi:protoporphyrinogen oxidase